MTLPEFSDLPFPLNDCRFENRSITLVTVRFSLAFILITGGDAFSQAANAIRLE
jgi:hypothetical protein